MSESIEKDRSWQRALDPMDRLSEVLFGLIMVLTFTCSLSVAEVGREDVKLMLIGALGCNLAWGLGSLAGLVGLGYQEYGPRPPAKISAASRH